MAEKTFATPVLDNNGSCSGCVCSCSQFKKTLSQFRREDSLCRHSWPDTRESELSYYILKSSMLYHNIGRLEYRIIKYRFLSLWLLITGTR